MEVFSLLANNKLDCSYLIFYYFPSCIKLRETPIFSGKPIDYIFYWQYPDLSSCCVIFSFIKLKLKVTKKFIKIIAEITLIPFYLCNKILIF